MKPEYILLVSSIILLIISILKKDHTLGLALFNRHLEFQGSKVGFTLILQFLILFALYNFTPNLNVDIWLWSIHISVTIFYSLFIMLTCLYPPIRNGKIGDHRRRSRFEHSIIPLGFLMWVCVQIIFLIILVKSL